MKFHMMFLPVFCTFSNSRYRGAERAIRMKRRPTKTVAQKKAAKKSAAGRNRRRANLKFNLKEMKEESGTCLFVEDSLMLRVFRVFHERVFLQKLCEVLKKQR